MKTYKIRRFYSPADGRQAEDVEGLTGLTLEEAEAHCNREDTREAGVYFDGYVEENPGEETLRKRAARDENWRQIFARCYGRQA